MVFCPPFSTLFSQRRIAANKPSLIASLEPELLFMIFKQLIPPPRIASDTGPRLAGLCLVCKKWLSPAREALYQRTTASSLSRANALYNTLTRYPELKSVVRYLEIPPIWTAVDHATTARLYFLTPRLTEPHDREQLQAYLGLMRRCALACRNLEEVRTSADGKFITNSPPRAPRIDKLLDPSNAHSFLRRLTLDDGGLHPSTVYDILPSSLRLDHLEELALRNFCFNTSTASQLFRGTTFYTDDMKVANLPRLHTLRLVHCTSEDGALLPLTSQVSRSLTSLTIVQRQGKYGISEQADAGRWHHALAHNETFAPIVRTMQHLALTMEFYRPAYYLRSTTLRALHIRAKKFHSSGVIDLPSTIQHLAITITDPFPDWISFKSRRRQHDVFDDLLTILSDDSLVFKVRRLRILDITLALELKSSIQCWVRLRDIQKRCRHARILLRIRMKDARLLLPWGEPLRSEGRDAGIVERRTVSSSDSPGMSPATPSGFLKGLHMGI